MTVDLHLDKGLDWYEFQMQAQSLLTLRNGNQCWTFWAHQSEHKGWDCEVRYASGDEAPYTRDGVFCGSERGFDIVAMERRVTAEDATARGLTEPNFEWPGKKYSGFAI